MLEYMYILMRTVAPFLDLLTYSENYKSCLFSSFGWEFMVCSGMEVEKHVDNNLGRKSSISLILYICTTELFICDIIYRHIKTHELFTTNSVWCMGNINSPWLWMQFIDICETNWFVWLYQNNTANQAWNIYCIASLSVAETWGLFY